VGLNRITLMDARREYRLVSVEFEPDGRGHVRATITAYGHREIGPYDAVDLAELNQRRAFVRQAREMARTIGWLDPAKPATGTTA
jgi:hypothetical protein